MKKIITKKRIRDSHNLIIIVIVIIIITIVIIIIIKSVLIFSQPPALFSRLGYVTAATMYRIHTYFSHILSVPCRYSTVHVCIVHRIYTVRTLYVCIQYYKVPHYLDQTICIAHPVLSSILCSKL